MALVLWRFVLALVLSFCAVATIAPRQAPAADVTVFLDQAKLLHCRRGLPPSSSATR
jgi:hypothetical protein